MQRKRTILILTSKDEFGCESVKLAEAIKRIGTRNVVIMSDDKYGSAAKMSALDRLMDSGSEYQYLLARKDKGVLKDKFRIKPLSKRVNRINNMIKRFHPEYILCNTPYAHHCAVEAKKRARFKTQIIYFMHTFTLGKRVHDDATSVYIVENADIKAELVRNGVKSKDVMVMGLPFDVKYKGDLQKRFAKQELGLPKAKTVFVNIQNKKALHKVFSLLLDQGEIINLAVYCPDQKTRQVLSSQSQKMPNMTILFLQSQDRIDECLSVCDIAITQYDIAIIYKCFRLGIVPVILSDNEHEQNDINYLVGHELCLKAKDAADTVYLMYKAFQSAVGEQISQNGIKWVEFSSLENIANFLVTYIAV